MNKVEAYITTDGKLFATPEGANRHEDKLVLEEKINHFMRMSCYTGFDHNFAIKLISDWESQRDHVNMIFKLGISASTAESLAHGGVINMRDIVRKTERQLLLIPGIDQIKVDAIVSQLGLKGITLPKDN